MEIRRGMTPAVYRNAAFRTTAYTHHFGCEFPRVIGGFGMAKSALFFLTCLSLFLSGCGRRIEDGRYALEREENGVRVVHVYTVHQNGLTTYQPFVKGEGLKGKYMVGRLSRFERGIRGQLQAEGVESFDEELTATDSPGLILSRHFSDSLRRWSDADCQMDLIRGGFESGVDFLKEQMGILGWHVGDNVRVAYDISRSPSAISGLEAKIHLSFPGKSYTATSTYAWNGEKWSYVRGELDRLDETFSRTLQDLPQFMPVRKL